MKKMLTVSKTDYEKDTEEKKQKTESGGFING